MSANVALISRQFIDTHPGVNRFEQNLQDKLSVVEQQNRESFIELKALRVDNRLMHRLIQERHDRVSEPLSALNSCFDQKLSMIKSTLLARSDEIELQISKKSLMDSSASNEPDASALVRFGAARYRTPSH